MGSTTKKVDTTPSEIQPLRQGIINWLGTNPTPPSVGGGQFSGTSMPTPVPQNPYASPTQGYTGGPGVGYGADTINPGTRYNQGSNNQPSTAALPPGFGGYDPTKPPPGYDPVAWNTSVGPRGTFNATTGERMYGVSRVDPSTGNTSWLGAGAMNPQSFWGLDANTRQYMASQMNPDQLNAMGWWQGGPPAGGIPSGGAAPPGTGGFNMQSVNPRLSPGLGMQSSPVPSGPGRGAPIPSGLIGGMQPMTNTIMSELPQTPVSQIPQLTGNNQPQRYGVQDAWNFFTGKGPPPPGFTPGGGPVPSNFSNIYAQRPDDPGRVQVGLTPDTAPLPGINAQYIDPMQYANMVGPVSQRNQVRDVGPQSTQSVDQLGGVNSAFFNNMMGQLSPAFDQRRAEALAAAKEASGNLTGSGYGNILGQAINRSLGDERADLAGYAAQGLNTEVGRQLQMAGLNQQGQMANQGADLGFLNHLLSQGTARAGLAGQLAQANQMANLRAQESTQGNELTRALSNRQMTQGVYNQQAGLDQQRNLELYNQLMGLSQGNANNFLQMLLGMSTAGVGPQQVVPTTWGSILNTAGTIGGMYAGKKWGP